MGNKYCCQSEKESELYLNKEKLIIIMEVIEDITSFVVAPLITDIYLPLIELILCFFNKMLSIIDNLITNIDKKLVLNYPILQSNVNEELDDLYNHLKLFFNFYEKNKGREERSYISFKNNCIQEINKIESLMLKSFNMSIVISFPCLNQKDKKETLLASFVKGFDKLVLKFEIIDNELNKKLANPNLNFMKNSQSLFASVFWICHLQLDENKIDWETFKNKFIEFDTEIYSSELDDLNDDSFWSKIKEKIGIKHFNNNVEFEDWDMFYRNIWSNYKKRKELLKIIKRNRN